MATKRKRKVNKSTKTYQRKEIRRLRIKALKLWAIAVKHVVGYKCVRCGSLDNLNSHHIESRSNIALRLDLRNGICLCPSCHKFGKESFHKSFITPYKYLVFHRPDDMDYLSEHYLDKPPEQTKEYFETKIEEFTSIIDRKLNFDGLDK
jgi:hypothetical protein